jgi:hypothetical protein
LSDRFGFRSRWAEGYGKEGYTAIKPLFCDRVGPQQPLNQPQSQPKAKRPPSPMQLEERERLVAEIKKHHPRATTEGIIVRDAKGHRGEVADA